MAEPTSCRTVPGTYCARVAALFNVPGVHVIDVGWRDDRLQVVVEAGPAAWHCAGAGWSPRATVDATGCCMTSGRSPLRAS